MKHERGTNGGFRRVWSQSEYSTGGEIIKFYNRRPIGERRTAGLNPPVRSPFSRVVGGYTAGFGGFGGYDSNASGLQGACGEETRGVEAKLLAVFQLNSPLAREAREPHHNQYNRPARRFRAPRRSRPLAHRGHAVFARGRFTKKGRIMATLSALVKDLDPAHIARGKAEDRVKTAAKLLDDAKQVEADARIIRDEALADLAHRLDAMGEDDDLERAQIDLDLSEINDTYRQAANALCRAEDDSADAKRALRSAVEEAAKYPIPTVEP